jgi:hypothetical protein
MGSSWLREADRQPLIAPTHRHHGSHWAARNELVVDGRGNAYVNGGGFDMMAGEDFAPGIVGCHS